jgi:hypothetical protein
VKKLLAFALTFGLVCALGLSTIGCSKKEEPKKTDTDTKEKEKGKGGT